MKEHRSLINNEKITKRTIVQSSPALKPLSKRTWPDGKGSSLILLLIKDTMTEKNPEVKTKVSGAADAAAMEDAGATGQ